MSAKLSTNEMMILSYLQGMIDFISPTQIGQDVGGKSSSGQWRHSAWASPICKKLVTKGLVERSQYGWYRAIV